MTVDEIRVVLQQSHALPAGRLKSERLELLAESAKAGGDRALECEVLLALDESYVWGAGRDRSPVVFGRILKLYDRFPEELSALSHDIFWQLKWMTNALVSHPSIPLATASRWLDEMESRYRQRGFSPRPVHATRAKLANSVCDMDAYSAAMEASIVAPRDEMADCDACERNGWGGWRVRIGDDEGALDHWAPVLDGERRCAEEPHRILAQALLPLVRTGRLAEARSAYLKGYPLVRNKISLRASVGRHIEFCALTGNEARGLEMLNEQLSWLTDEHEDLGQRLEFLSGVVVLLRRLVELGHGDLPLGSGSVRVTLADLEREIRGICARHDARNGNSRFSERIERRLSQQPLLDNLPIGSAAELPEAEPVPVHRTNAPLEELLAEARRLSRLRHPKAVAAWERVAAFPDLTEEASAGVARSRAGTLFETDEEASYQALLEVADRFERLGDQARAWEARSGAAGVLSVSGDAAEAEQILDAVIEQAALAHEAGEIEPWEYLGVRKTLAFLAMSKADDDPEGARAVITAECELAERFEAHDRIAGCLDMLGRISLQDGAYDTGREQLTAAVEQYVLAEQPWLAVDASEVLGQLALGLDDDAPAAETYIVQALEFGAGTLVREKAAQLGSLLVEAIARQQERQLDLVSAALGAAVRWSGLSEPDRLHNTFIAARAYLELGSHAEAVALFDEVIPLVEVPYEGAVVAMRRGQYGDGLNTLGRYRDAAEQFLLAARIVQDDPENQNMHANLAWSAAENLQYSGQTSQALAAYRRAADLWATLDVLANKVRCLRSAAWLLAFEGQKDDGLALMKAVLAELESSVPTEEVMDELRATREQLISLNRYEPDDDD